MKNRLFILFAIVVIILGLAGWLWWPRTAETIRQVVIPPTAAKTNTSTPPTAVVTLVPSIPSKLINPTAPPDPEAIKNAVASGDKGQIGVAIMSLANARPIDVYGKVIDQDGQPVADAVVNGKVMMAAGADSSPISTYTTKTDEQGLFQFTDLHGWKFGLVVKKDGYISSNERPGSYIPPNKEDITSSSERDTIVVWKLKEAVPLVHQRLQVKLACDGTPTNIDLLTGKPVNKNGNLVVSFVRNPVQIHRGTPFEWSLTLKISDGGFAEITGPYPYEAPESGYEQTMTVSMAADAQPWSSSFGNTYYFTSNNGKIYGRITITLQADFQPPPTFFRIDTYINPSGSRDLEPAQSK